MVRIEDVCNSNVMFSKVSITADPIENVGMDDEVAVTDFVMVPV